VLCFFCSTLKCIFIRGVVIALFHDSKHIMILNSQYDIIVILQGIWYKVNKNFYC